MQKKQKNNRASFTFKAALRTTISAYSNTLEIGINIFRDLVREQERENINVTISKVELLITLLCITKDAFATHPAAQLLSVAIDRSHT